jgi:hypothetical protein
MRTPRFTFFLSLMFAAGLAPAQVAPKVPPGSLAQLQIQQPAPDINSPITASVQFTPPVIGMGETAWLQIKVEATESAITWPDKLNAPPGLACRLVAHGSVLQNLNGRFRPLSAFVYEIKPSATGQFTLPAFSVQAAGQTVEIPAATLTVLAASPGPQLVRKLLLQPAITNVYLGQPFRMRVMLPAGPANEIEALRELQFSTEGLMIDKISSHQFVETVSVGNQLKPAYVSELLVTPIAAGTLNFYAQAFTAGHDFSGPISISGQVSIPGGPPSYTLLLSDPTSIQVRPLPTHNVPPGYTGSLGRFSQDPPTLATNLVHVGEPVHLKINLIIGNEISRLVPPATPRSRDWQIIADRDPELGFTLIPLTDEVHTTPTIPYSSFDPDTGNYVNLTIPALPITVVGEGLPLAVTTPADESVPNAPTRLSELAAKPGKSVSRLEPLQKRGWFIACQLLPLLGLFVLWQWDRRRRFLEAHPEIVRRRAAKRALRRERRQLQRAVAANDNPAFVQHAAAAMKIAAAPLHPAQAQALVGADVLWPGLLSPAEVETVHAIFAAAEARFAAQPPTPAELLKLHADVLAVLQKLEAAL